MCVCDREYPKITMNSGTLNYLTGHLTRLVVSKDLGMIKGKTWKGTIFRYIHSLLTTTYIDTAYSS